MFGSFTSFDEKLVHGLTLFEVVFISDEIMIFVRIGIQVIKFCLVGAAPLGVSPLFGSD